MKKTTVGGLRLVLSGKVYTCLSSHIAYLMSDFSQDRHGWSTPTVCDTSLDGMAEMNAVSLEIKHKFELQNTRPKL